MVTRKYFFVQEFRSFWHFLKSLEWIWKLSVGSKKEQDREKLTEKHKTAGVKFIKKYDCVSLFWLRFNRLQSSIGSFYNHNCQRSR